MSLGTHFNHHSIVHTFTILLDFAVDPQLLAQFEISLGLFCQGRKGLQNRKFLKMYTLQRSAVKAHTLSHTA